MQELNELSNYDFPDTEMIPNGYDISTVPTMSNENFRILLGEHNKMVCTVNGLLEKVETLEREKLNG